MSIIENKSGIEITTEMEISRQDVIETNEGLMKFEQALKSLREGNLLARKSWSGKLLKMSNDAIVVLNNNTDTAIKWISAYQKWDSPQEDILAEDWICIDPDDIKEFYLSANKLKSLGVKEEALEELKNEYKTPVEKILDKSELKLDLNKVMNQIEPAYLKIKPTQFLGR